MNEIKLKLPTTFWIISIVALLWNLLGLMSFFVQLMMTDEAIAALPEAEKALYEATPGWLNVIYGIAVVTGSLGSISLLIKKSWAIPLFLISLVAVLIQMSYSIFLTDAYSVYGWQSLMMPILVILISAFLWYYAKQCHAKGWLV